MYKTKDTKNVPYLFFLINTVISLIAVYYGLVVSNSTLILVNGVGTILWGLYVFVYVAVSRSKSWPVAQVLMLALLLLGHLLYLKLFTPYPPALASTLGFFLFVWSVVVLLTPILDIVQIARERSAEGTSIPLLLGGTLCCLAWLAYGYLLNDFFVYAPNILGLGVNFAKFVAMGVYSGAKFKGKTL
ncbi:sugar transporter SWEET1-like isoform X2 [Pomacea canaliculata]|nr:sugar transporter SWEET1-like isoform X2 [Pomacea canaliculata]XP_025077108.1 sugar transporter SWEET1-like isoform X2 [Pomacea canaliculata]XP_025077109.1 sugar transporter SWEET1-like isoform X2 [Pomacea canaliculata]XP_025077110.1 sugar transporter SWEET1-like isoform X2 [Pomacea canaliculata]XP_025077111.1 sugar transporter SWEET1-like isoform X2 [Pomacea canaliculata]XP_025077112.1 sugar transporter SWEET1-like isoform X2 [Pomacea canaliculata]